MDWQYPTGFFRREVIHMSSPGKQRSRQCEVLLYISDYALMCAEQLVLMSKHRYQTGPPHGSSADALYRVSALFSFEVCLDWDRSHQKFSLGLIWLPFTLRHLPQVITRNA